MIVAQNLLVLPAPCQKNKFQGDGTKITLGNGTAKINLMNTDELTMHGDIRLKR